MACFLFVFVFFYHFLISCQINLCLVFKFNLGVNGVPSNLLVKFHNVSWTTTKGTPTFHDPDVVLACHFDRLNGQSLYYDVTWYADDTEVLSNQTVSSDSLDLPLLTGTQMFEKGKKANSMVISQAKI